MIPPFSYITDIVYLCYYITVCSDLILNSENISERNFDSLTNNREVYFNKKTPFKDAF